MTRSSLIALAAATTLLAGACRQDMHDQPKAKPQSKSAFFADGRTGRLPVEGTVAQGDLREDDHLFRGRVNGAFATTFPFPIDMAVMQRGHERYNIFCAPCHGRTGLGDGMVVQRGHKIAQSHHIDRLREQPVGYWFDVITNGFGAMYGYSAQIPVNDRWAIVAYVRALQLSRRATLEDIPEDKRAQVQAGQTVGASGPAATHGAAPAAHSAPAANPAETKPAATEGRH